MARLKAENARVKEDQDLYKQVGAARRRRCAS